MHAAHVHMRSPLFRCHTRAECINSRMHIHPQRRADSVGAAAGAELSSRPDRRQKTHIFPGVNGMVTGPDTRRGTPVLQPELALQFVALAGHQLAQFLQQCGAAIRFPGHRRAHILHCSQVAEMRHPTRRSDPVLSSVVRSAAKPAALAQHTGRTSLGCPHDPREGQPRLCRITQQPAHRDTDTATRTELKKDKHRSYRTDAGLIRLANRIRRSTPTCRRPQTERTATAHAAAWIRPQFIPLQPRSSVRV